MESLLNVPHYSIIPSFQAAEPISDYFDEAADFIEEALGGKESVLVHCEAGRSRSATIVMAFLMRRDHCSLSEALSKVQSLLSHRRLPFPSSALICSECVALKCILTYWHR